MIGSRPLPVSFLGTYEVIRRLATGGMADVFLARQTIGGRSERLVVIKSILRGLADRPEFVTMFLEEANVAAQLQHPNIVQILDVSLLGNRPCIVMEYLNGADTAWIRDLAQEEALVAAMRRGTSMTVTGRSRTGVETTDTYSLFGTTAALERSAEECR